MCRKEKLTLSFEMKKAVGSERDEANRAVSKLFSESYSDGDANKNKEYDISLNKGECEKSEKFYRDHPELLLEFETSNIHNDSDDCKVRKVDNPKKNNAIGKSRYMNKIQEYVNLRNIEKQELNEEKIQREIQIENNDQVFITNSYKAVLEERDALKSKFSKKRLINDTKSFEKNIFNLRFNKDNSENTHVYDNIDKTDDDYKNRASPEGVILGNGSKSSQTAFDLEKYKDTTLEKDKNLVSNSRSSEETNSHFNDVELKIKEARERYFYRKHSKLLNLKRM